MKKIIRKTAKKNTARGIIAASVLAAFTLAAPEAAWAGQWQQDEGGWRWRNDDGTYLADCWEWIDGNQDGISEYYYFFPDGYMARDVYVQDGSYINENGELTVGGEVKTMEFQPESFDAERIQENLDQAKINELIFNAVNQERAKHGLSALRQNQELRLNAGVRAVEIPEQTVHIRPDGSAFHTAITVPYQSASENFGLMYMPNLVTEEEVADYLLSGWLASGMHRDNIRKSQWQECGIGVYIEGNCIYVVQLFI